MDGGIRFMRKVVMFGAGDHVRKMMKGETLATLVDYFVDNSPSLQGQTLLNKEIKHPNALLAEDKNNLLIIIASIVFRTEIKIQLEKMGFKEGEQFVWSLDFSNYASKNKESFGGATGGGIYDTFEWRSNKNPSIIHENSRDDFSQNRLLALSSLANWQKYETVLDLGAANERLREFLPDNVRYIPVDYIKYSNQTLFCDLNKEFPDSAMLHYSPRNTIMVSSGNLCYISDWKGHLANIAKNSAALLLSTGYALGRIPAFGAKKSFAFSFDIIIEMQKHNFQLTAACDYRLLQECLLFERRDWL
jgi:hypothetical protein